MQMNIEVKSADVSVIPTKKGSYKCAEITYKDLKDGKLQGKKVMDFACKKGFELLVPGAAVTVLVEKEPGADGKEYWQWKEVTPTVAGTVAPASFGTPSPKSNYETAEERAKRQDFIIRQSSLTNAIATLTVNPGKERLSPDDIEALAERYVAFVYQKNSNPVNTVAELEDDIPY